MMTCEIEDKCVSLINCNVEADENNCPRASCADQSESFLQEGSSSSSAAVVSLVSAICMKYTSSLQPSAASTDCPILNFGDVEVAFVLQGKRGSSGCLELLVLDDYGIGVAGDFSALPRTLCVQRITELDLAKNRLEDWSEIATILSAMPLLTHCNLSQNSLSAPIPEQFFEAVPDSSSAASCSCPDGDDMIVGRLREPLSRMNSLVLNSTQVSWDAVCWFYSIMPNLEELHLSLNDLRSMPSSARLESASFSSIHVLHLNRCSIQTWDDLVAVLRPFCTLETLVATDNPIDSIGLSEEQAQTVLGCLQNLNINYWLLNRWSDLEQLRRLPLLCELRALKLPLLENLTEEERRFLVVARLPDVSTLNGSQVTAEQRENAERFFIRYHANAADKPLRALELESIYGRLEPLVDVDLSPPTEVEVQLVFETRRESRKVCVRQSVGHFKKSLESFAGQPVSNFRLFHKVHFSVAMEELKLPKVMLYALPIRPGDEFHVQEKMTVPSRLRNSSASSSYQFLKSPLRSNANNT